MAKISLTSFVDFVSSSGTHRITAARKALSVEAYSPATDYYKAIRERIIDTQRQNLPKEHLLNIVHHITDQKKLHNYLTIADCYTKWIGNKKITWIEPLQTEFGTNKIQIRVNPEIGISHNGNNFFIKLYFKADPLAKHKADMIIELMNMALQKHVYEPTSMAVLDIRSQKLFVQTVQKPMISEAVYAELSYLESLSATL